MKTKRVINFGIFAHIDAGKTTLTERILFQEGVISSFGDIESGTTETDFLEEEISRGISIQSVVVQFDRIFRNEKFKINLIDTPGHLDFDEQVSEIVGVIDLGVLVVDVRSKVQSQTEILWKKLSEKKIPTIFFLNKTDSTDLDLRKIISELKAEFKSNLHPAFFFKKDAAAKTESILKAEKKDENILIPFLEWDSSLSEKFLESPEKIKSIAMEGLKNGFHLRAFFPVLAGSAKTGAGVGDLLDFICFVDWSSENATSRENDSVYAFKKQIHPDYGKIYFLKTLQDLNRGEALFYGSERIKLERIFSPKAMNLEEIDTAEKGGIFAAVISADIPKGTTLTKAPSLLNLFGARTKGENSQQFGVVIEPVSGEDLAKLQNSVHELIWEDDSYSAKIQKFTGQLELWGQGELHIEIGLSRLAKKIGEIFSVGKLKVARYEIWKNVTEKHVFTHSIQDGMQKSGEITVFLEKSNDLNRSIFFEKNVPEEIHNPIRDGFEEIMSHGNFGEEILGVNFRIVSYEKPNDFNYPSLSLLKVAAISGLKSSIEGRTELVGPLSSFEVVAPDFSLGKVLAELKSRSARILNVSDGDFQVCHVIGEVSTENLLGFAASLRNMTKGKGIVQSKVTFSALKYCVIEIK